MQSHDVGRTERVSEFRQRHSYSLQLLPHFTLFANSNGLSPFNQTVLDCHHCMRLASPILFPPSGDGSYGAGTVMLFNGVYKLSDEPEVLAVQGKNSLDHVIDNFTGQPPIVIWHNDWYYGSIRKMWKLRGYFKRANASGIIAAESTSCDGEEIWRRLFGLPGFPGIPYVYVNEHEFTVSSHEKIYDAVYSARLRKIKRLRLARKVQSLFVLTYKGGLQEWDLHQYAPSLKHAKFNPTFCDPTQREEIFGQSRVGLCLSKIEGCMFSSLEYMLSGLPIVSTRSTGGRDQFYDDEFCLIVRASASAVRDGVKEMIKRQIPGETIRQKTLDRLDNHRQRYVASICEFVEQQTGMILDESSLYAKMTRPKDQFIRLKDFPQVAQAKAA